MEDSSPSGVNKEPQDRVRKLVVPLHVFKAAVGDPRRFDFLTGVGLAGGEVAKRDGKVVLGT